MFRSYLNFNYKFFSFDYVFNNIKDENIKKEIFIEFGKIINSINAALLGKTCKVNITLKELSFDTTISPIFDLEQNVIGATGLFIDISSQITKKPSDENDSKLILLNKINNQILFEAEEYKRSNKLLEASQSIAKLGGWELDLITKELYWTPQTYLIHDTSPEEFNPTLDAGLNFYLPESKKYR